MHWLYSVALAAITVPLGVLMRFIPVCSKPADFAEYYQHFFNEKMRKTLADNMETHPVFTRKVSQEPHLNPHAQVAGLPSLSLTSPHSPVQMPLGNPLSPTNELGLITGVIASPSFGTVPGIELQNVHVHAPTSPDMIVKPFQS
jgi:hypothetical protein